MLFSALSVPIKASAVRMNSAAGSSGSNGGDPSSSCIALAIGPYY
jgi:hypothetical protein